MTTKAEARSVIAKRFGAKQDRLDSWPAYLGNEDGTVTGSRTGYVYVRYPASNSAAVEVYNGGVPEVAGLRIMVGYRPERPDLIQALGVADVRQEVSTTVLYGITQNHARQHFWTGSDPVYTTFHQVTALGVYPDTGLTVTIYAGFIQRESTIIEIPAQTLDLSSYQPANPGEGLYALITLDPYGDVYVTSGVTVADYTFITASNIPVTPVGHFRLAAVRLYYGQTSIQDTSLVTDIYDLRWPQESLSISPIMYQTVTNGNAGSLSIGMPVYLSASTTVNKARANALATSLVVGLMTGTVTTGDSGQFQLNGQITATTSEWDTISGETGGLTVGAYYYLDAATAGHITKTAPTDPSQFVIKIGTALSATLMLIDVDPSSSVIVGSANTVFDDVATVGDAGSNYSSIATAVSTADLTNLILVTPGVYAEQVTHAKTDALYLTGLQHFGQEVNLNYTSGAPLVLSSGTAVVSNLKITGGSAGAPVISITSTESTAMVHLIDTDIQVSGAATDAIDNSSANHYWVWAERCRFIGAVKLRETAYLSNCIVYGNVTLTNGGANAANDYETSAPLVEIRGGKIIGNLTVGASVVCVLKNLPQITGTVTNSGSIVGLYTDGNGAICGKPVIISGGQQGTYNTTAINLTLTAAHHWVKVTAACTITLPTAASISGREYIISATAANVIVDGDGSETIDGYATWTMSANSTMQIKSDGAGWIII